jgi:hypothetical protein
MFMDLGSEGFGPGSPAAATAHAGSGIRALRCPWRFTPKYAIDAKARRSRDASFKRMKKNNKLARVFAIAPMMEWADRAEKQNVIST